MSEENRQSLEELIVKLKQERDELALKMHLGKAELKDEWDTVQRKLDQLTHRFEPLNSRRRNFRGCVGVSQAGWRGNQSRLSSYSQVAVSESDGKE